jgi:hypothetical protein
MKYIYVLVLLIACTSCKTEGMLPSFSSDLLPAEVEGFRLKGMVSGPASGDTLCDTVDMGSYFRVGPDGGIRRDEKVSAVVCQSSAPEREFEIKAAELNEVSGHVSDFYLKAGITGKYYSPFDKHVYILWQDGDLTCHVSSVSASGNGHEIAVAVSNAMISHIGAQGGEGPPVHADAREETDCPLPGKLVHWRVDYCMWKAGTDDYLESSVQQCEDKRTAVDDKLMTTACQKKQYYHRKICEMSIGQGLYSGTMRKCIDEILPRTVREGGV